MSYGVSSTSSNLAAEPKHKGTLACVVLKAKNLPNKRSIGKQDPFAVLSIGDEKQRTKPDKRGGQHPTWDEQLHFEIYDDAEDIVSGVDGSMSKSSSSSSSSSAVKKPGKKILKIACYADDNKEPDFIAEGQVDLTDVLKTGEFDEWVTIRHKDRYCGEVYLELTFFSSAPRPKRTKKIRPTTDSIGIGGTYGGAGTFTADLDDDFGPPRPDNQPRTSYPALPPSMRTGGHHGRLSTSSSVASGLYTQPYREEGAPAMRPSTSLAGMAATYTPPYAPAGAIQQRPTSPQPPPLPPQGYRAHSPLPSSATMPVMDHHHHQRRSSTLAQDVSDHSAYAAIPGQGIPTSYSQSFSGHAAMPSSYSTTSVMTVRPGSAQPPADDPINDLIRPLSSMSVGSTASASRPLPPPTPNTAYPQGGAEHRYAPSAPSTPQQPPRWEQQHQQRVSHNLNPSYAYASAAPVPPPPSQSAPPQMPYSQSSHQIQYHHQSPPRDDLHDLHQRQGSSQQVHPAQTFVPSTLAHSHNHPPTPVHDPYRPASPAVPPPRPISSSSYHALPPVPNQGYRAHSPQPQHQSYYQVSPQPHHQSQPQPPPPAQQSYYDQHQQDGRAVSPAPPPPPQGGPFYAPQQSAWTDQQSQPPPHPTYRPQAQYSRSPSPSKSSRPLPPTSPGIPPSNSATPLHDGYYQHDPLQQHQSTRSNGPPPPPLSTLSNGYGNYVQQQHGTASSSGGYYASGQGQQGGEYSPSSYRQPQHPPPPPPPPQQEVGQIYSYPSQAAGSYDGVPHHPHHPHPPPGPPQHSYQQVSQDQRIHYHDQPQTPRSPQPAGGGGGGGIAGNGHASSSSSSSNVGTTTSATGGGGGGGGGYIASAPAPVSQLLNSSPSSSSSASLHHLYHQQQQQQQQQSGYYR